MEGNTDYGDIRIQLFWYKKLLEADVKNQEELKLCKELLKIVVHGNA